MIVPFSQILAQINEKIVLIDMSLYPNAQSYYSLINNSQTNSSWFQIKNNYSSVIQQQGGIHHFVEDASNFRKGNVFIWEINI